MLVSSTLCPSHRSPVHLFVVHYDEDRVLVPVDLYAKYADLQDYVAREWNLERANIEFETDELNICAGKKIRIHEEAWIGIKDIVGNVYVRVLYPNQPSVRSEGQRDTLAHNVKHVPKREVLETIRASSETAHEAEVEKQTSTETLESEYVDVAPPDENHGQDSEVNGHEHEPSSDPTGSPKPLGEEEGKESLKDKEKEKEHSPGRSSTWGQLLDSGRAAPENPPNNVTTTSTGSTFCTCTSTRCSAREAKIGSRLHHKPSPRKAASGDPEHILIKVTPPPNSIYNPRWFRVRREDSVRSVLKAACKAFRVDHTKVELLHNGGDEGDLLFQCYSDQTMEDLNVQDNHEFVVERVN